MDPDSNTFDQHRFAVPEALMTWLSQGRPGSPPREVQDWLEQDEDAESVLHELVLVWDATGTPPPPDLWEQISARIGPPNADRREPARARSRWKASLPLAAMLLLGLGLGYLWPILQASIGAAAERVIVHVPPGSRSDLTLPGGVRVQLNSGSRLTYPGGATVEEVSLEGEAYFEVEHDPDRTFHVVTSGGVIRDIGTEFNVEARAGTVSVVVTQGEVSLSTEGGTLNVARGQKARASAAEPPSFESGFVLAAELAWIEGRFAFYDAPLDQILAALERHYAIDIAMAPGLGRKRVTTVMSAPAAAEDALRVVCEAAPAHCERTGDKSWVVRTDE